MLRTVVLRVATLVVLVFSLVVACSEHPNDRVTIPDPNFAKLPYPPVPPPPQETNAHVVVYGGVHTGAGNRSLHRSIISKAVGFHSSHIFNLGDLTEAGNDSTEWANFKYDISQINPYPIGYFPALGEHDDPATYFDQFPNLPGNGGQPDPHYYYVEHQTALFIVLDISSEGTTAPAGFAAQKDWLENVLDSHDGDNIFRFVFMHVHSLRTNSDVGRAAYAAELDPIFQEHGVDIVFMGHTHGYQRWNIGGVNYVVTAGGGAPLASIEHFPPACVVNDAVNHYVTMFLSGDNGTVSVKDMAGNEIDALTLVKGQSVPPPPTVERIAIHGDTHGGQSPTADAVHTNVVGRIVAFDPDMVFNTGDVVQTGAPTTNFGIFNAIRSQLCDVPYYPTLGNHDGSAVNDYLANFPYLPTNGDGSGKYYYVDSEFARFVVLEVDKQGSTPPTNWGTQKAWLSGTLSSAGDVFKFVFFHVPRTSTATVENRGVAEYADEIEPMLIANGVHAVFTGHIHSYQRFDNFGTATNTYQIITGGAGGFLHEFSYQPPVEMPILEAHNYIEMQLTSDVATVKVYTLPPNQTSGSFTLYETVTINK